jgi:hypothetical protein
MNHIYHTAAYAALYGASAYITSHPMGVIGGTIFGGVSSLITINIHQRTNDFFLKFVSNNALNFSFLYFCGYANSLIDYYGIAYLPVHALYHAVTVHPYTSIITAIALVFAARAGMISFRIPREADQRHQGDGLYQGLAQ